MSIRTTMLSIVVLTIVVAVGTAAPRSRSAVSRYREQQRQQVEAARQQQIKSLQLQLAAAKRMLEQADSRQELTAQQFEAAAGKLQSARTALEAIDVDHNEFHHRLKAIEEKIVANQSDDSELAQALAAVEAARAAQHAAFHRATGGALHETPTEGERLTELADLTAAQRAALKADAEYQQASKEVRQASTHVNLVERKLFEQDSEWKRAHADHLADEAKRKRSSNEASRSGLEHYKAGQELRTVAQLKAQAQAVITQCETRLKQLQSGQ